MDRLFRLCGLEGTLQEPTIVLQTKLTSLTTRRLSGDVSSHPNSPLLDLIVGLFIVSFIEGPKGHRTAETAETLIAPLVHPPISVTVLGHYPLEINIPSLFSWTLTREPALLVLVF